MLLRLQNWPRKGSIVVVFPTKYIKKISYKCPFNVATPTERYTPLYKIDNTLSIPNRQFDRLMLNIFSILVQSKTEYPGLLAGVG